MKRKSLVLAAVIAACATSLVFATPQTQWEQDQWQVDLGAWNPKAEVDSDKIVGSELVMAMLALIQNGISRVVLPMG